MSSGDRLNASQETTGSLKSCTTVALGKSRYAGTPSPDPGAPAWQGQLAGSARLATERPTNRSTPSHLGMPDGVRTTFHQMDIPRPSGTGIVSVNTGNHPVSRTRESSG